MGNQDIFKVLKERKVMQVEDGIKLTYVEGISSKIIDIMYGKNKNYPKCAWDVLRGLGTNSKLKNNLGAYGVTPSFDESSIVFNLWGFKDQQPSYFGGVDGYIVKQGDEDDYQRRISILIRSDVNSSDDVLGYLLDAALEELQDISPTIW